MGSAYTNILGMNKIILTEFEIKNIIELYNSGLNVKNVAIKANVTKWAVIKTLKGKMRPSIIKKIPLNIIFKENSNYSRGNLSTLIIKERILNYKCEICLNDGYWNGKFLRLQIDHINGIGTDHRIENLRFLCYNCHSQTETFGGKNVKKKKIKKVKKIFFTYNPSLYKDYLPNVSFREKKNIIWTIPLDQLKLITAKFNTLADILRHFNYPLKGAQYKALKERLFWEKIDFSHIKFGEPYLKGKKVEYKPKFSSEEVFIENSKYTRPNVKIRAFKENLLSNICYVCSQEPYWNNKALVLQLDHINGISNDNRVENLRILCPNCHTQTATYCSRIKSNAKI